MQGCITGVWVEKGGSENGCNMGQMQHEQNKTTLVLQEISATNLFCSNITLLTILMILISALYNSFL